MADYKKMYKILFNSMPEISRIIEASQKEVEDIYINSEEQPIRLSDSEMMSIKIWDEINKVVDDIK